MDTKRFAPNKPSRLWRLTKPTINNTPVMANFIHHITSVNRHGKDWMCQLKNGFRLRVTDSLMTEVAQLGK